MTNDSINCVSLFICFLFVHFVVSLFFFFKGELLLNACTYSHYRFFLFYHVFIYFFNKRIVSKKAKIEGRVSSHPVKVSLKSDVGKFLGGGG